MRRRGTLKYYEAPNYAGMSNVVFHHRAQELETNTTNSAGVVNASGHVTKIISILGTPHEFDGNGTAANITLTGSGVNKEIAFAGSARLRHNGLSSVWDNFQYRATLTDLKATIHGVFKFGTGSNPNALYGLFGNYAASSANKGVGAYFDDRSPTLNNHFNLTIVRGTSSNFVLQATNSDILIPNVYHDIWIQYDFSQGQANKEGVGLLVIDGREYVLGIRMDVTTPQATPSFAMEIGNVGNALAIGNLVGSIKEITFQDGVETAAFRRNFIINRMAKYGLIGPAHSTSDIIFRSQLRITDELTETRYYLPVCLFQNPNTPSTINQIFRDTVTHVYDAGGKASRRKSTDGLRTFAAKQDVFNPSGAEAVLSVGGGYDSAGKLHFFANTQTAGNNTSTNKMYYAYSTDDGDTWSSFTDITSSLTSDLLGGFIVDQTMIETNGALIISYYKFTQNGDVSESANYILKSTDGGSTWASKTIRAKSSTYRNEGTLVALTSTNIFYLCRDEVTLEWRAYKSTDTGENWSDLGAFDIGESLTRATPPLLRKFLLNGTSVVVFYWARRDLDQLCAAYVVTATLDSTGISAFTGGTKVVLAQGNDDNHYHYGDVCHWNNDMNAVASWPYDPYPGTGAGTENTLRTFNLITAQYDSIKTFLGL